MKAPLFAVQASSTSWSGGPDLCMNELDGRPAVAWTVERILEAATGARVVVVAPEFDRGGALDALRAGLSVYYGHDASPLDRLLAVTADYPDDSWFVRVDGLHCFFDVEKSLEMWRRACTEGLDCMKFPDGWPPQFASEVYRVGALRRLPSLVGNQPEYRVHPRFFLFRDPTVFRCAYLGALPEYSADFLRTCREKASAIYLPREEHHDAKRVAAGDAQRFRYEVGARHLQASDRVLDIACGHGQGTRYLATLAREVCGADLDESTIREIRKDPDNPPNVTFRVEDAACLSFDDEAFDAVVSIETIEHVDDGPYLREIHRVLKPRGRFFLSTPQNVLGHVPVNNEHVREYSLEGLLERCGEFFEITKAIGQKAGRIAFDDDPTGSTTLLLCRKR